MNAGQLLERIATTLKRNIGPVEWKRLVERRAPFRSPSVLSC
jgi:hypothetical protein